MAEEKYLRQYEKSATGNYLLKQRGLLENQILDEMAMRGIPPAVLLDQAGYNPRDQHLYRDTPVGPVNPNLVLLNVLNRIRGLK